MDIHQPPMRGGRGRSCRCCGTNPCNLRTLAQTLGVKKYWPGVPCQNGHLDYRRTHSGDCVTCDREQTKRWRRRHPEKRLEHTRRHNKTYRARHWQKEQSRAAARRAMHKNIECPVEKALVEEIYLIRDICAELLGEPCHVDHIKPIAAGGQHKYHNLQVLTARENHRKSYKYEETEPNGTAKS